MHNVNFVKESGPKKSFAYQNAEKSAVKKSGNS